MNNIQTLSTTTINQIAAGEVIERPVHLVKELIENSIDAHATEIEVHIKDGGRSVSVTDNGCGIKKDQLQLALSRHATSKIKSIEDIWSHKLLGFRGEALSSIGSISSLKLSSKTEDQKESYSVQCEFGQMSEPILSGSRQGTKIELKELFKNVPARLKFLKSENAENLQIKKIFRDLSLVHYNVSFKLRVNNELVFLWTKQSSLEKRVKDILSPVNLYFVENQLGSIQTQVFFSSPDKTVKTRKDISIFVQNRPVKDFTIQKSILDSYKTFLMHGEYPIVLAFIKCHPQEIDINIHPTKSEVKFQNSSNVYRAVYGGLKSGLEKSPWLSDILSQRQPMTPSLEANKNNSIHYSLKPSSEAHTNSTINHVKINQKEGFFTNNFLGKNDKKKTVKDKNFLLNKSDFAQIQYKKESFVKASDINYTSDEGFSSLDLVGQSHLTYLVTQSAESIIFIDQHAAHERVLFEKLLQSFKSGQYENQEKLIPFKKKCEVINEIKKYEKHFSKWGLNLEFTKESVRVVSHPHFLNETAIDKALDIFFHDIEQGGGSRAIDEIFYSMFAKLACHSAIRAGDVLSLEQMKNLLKEMDEYKSSFCPHGRPVFVKYPIARLEKDFGRVV